MKRLTKQKAIGEYCRECAGGSAKEVTLCILFDCPLWEYRTGSSTESVTYARRMRGARERYGEEINSLEKLGIDTTRFDR